MTTKALKVFFIYASILGGFIIVTTAAVYVFNSTRTYYYILKIYALAEYILFSQFLYNLYQNSIAKKIILYSILPFAVFCIIDFFINKELFSNSPSLVEFLAFIMFIIYFFYEKMKTVVLYPLYQSITFWICVGLFLYFAGNFFFFLFINSSSDPTFIGQMKNIYFIVTISKNLLFCFAFLATEPNEKVNDELQMPPEFQLDEFTVTNLKKP